MNKYTGLSDFEINKKVAEKLGIRLTPRNGVLILSATKLFNPCNNPSDAMPIIIKDKICLTVGDSDDIWVADTTRSLESSFNERPLRAAMEVYLLMKDAENEG
ncbi:phage protein NinX family protein [Providencia sp.]|uniref:phage protein NinX family protein n=1 Tax=Providencia sp. TaxID=589 RepID=UPI00334016B6